MKKRLISIPVLIVFVLSTFAFSKSASAYQNNSYFSSIKVGLTIMAAPTMYVTLNGNYTVGQNKLPSGTKFTLYIKNGRVIYNGQAYDSLILTPQDPQTTVTLKSTPYSFTYIRSYMGAITFKDINGRVFPINTLNIEDYLLGVIGYEMSESYSLEALKAQAITARTYALYELGRYKSLGYDVSDTTDCQVYHGYNPYYTKVAQAVDDTRGVVLVSNYGSKANPQDRLVAAFFEASDGGYTEACQNVWLQSFPYLTEKKDDFDSYSWTSTFTNSQIESRLKSDGYLSASDKFDRIDLSSISTYPSGRIKNITIGYKTSAGYYRTKSFSKDNARMFLSLKSALYTVAYSNGVYTFTGKGYGHGLGLSQIGAENRAEAGQSAEDILAFYFNNTYLVKLNANIKSLNLSTSQVETGSKITFNTALQGNSINDYMYKYVVQLNGNTVFTRDYSFSSSADYTPEKPGVYSVSAYIKNRYSDEIYDDTSSLLFNTYSPPVISGINGTNAVLAGENAFFKGTQTSGSGQGYLFRYNVEKDGKVIYTGTNRETEGSTSDFSYAPQEAGNYTAHLYLKDALSTRDYDTDKTWNFTVYSQPVITNLGMSPDKPVVNKSIGIKVSVNGGSPSGLKYTYTVTKSGSTLTSGTTSSSSFSFTPASGGQYQVAVKVKDNLSSKEYNSLKSITIDVASSSDPVLFSISRTLQIGMSGSDVVALQKALKSLGCFNYYTTTTYFGSVTKGAVTAFQKKYGLSQNGVADARVASLINTELLKLPVSTSGSAAGTSSASTSTASKVAFNPSRSLSLGMSGSDISQLQQILKNLGYYTYSSITGYFGSATRGAVIAFQRATGISPIGIVGPQTKSKINERLQ